MAGKNPDLVIPRAAASLDGIGGETVEGRYREKLGGFAFTGRWAAFAGKGQGKKSTGQGHKAFCRPGLGFVDVPIPITMVRSLEPGTSRPSSQKNCRHVSGVMGIAEWEFSRPAVPSDPQRLIQLIGKAPFEDIPEAGVGAPDCPGGPGKSFSDLHGFGAVERLRMGHRRANCSTPRCGL